MKQLENKGFCAYNDASREGVCTTRPARLTTKPFVGAKRIMATAYPIVPGVTFKDVVGFPDYCVGDDGSVWTKRHLRRYPNSPQKWKRMTGFSDPRYGHCYVLLRDNSSNQRHHSIHRLVLTAFVGPCPTGHEACHFPDRNPKNNRLDNLRWGTHEENSQHSRIHGTMILGSKHVFAKINEQDVRTIKNLRRQGWTHRAIAEHMGIKANRVFVVLSGRKWRHIQ